MDLPGKANRGAPETSDLGQLVDEMREADPSELIVRFRGPLSSQGAEGIVAMAPLLEDDNRRHAVAIIIREMAKGGPDDQAAACEVLVAALATVRPVGQDFLLRTLEASGCQVPDDTFPTGTQYTPIAGAITAHHAVIDIVLNSGTDFGPLYLAACHWAFSRVWVDKHGGLLSSHGGRYCWFCARVFGNGSPT